MTSGGGVSISDEANGGAPNGTGTAGLTETVSALALDTALRQQSPDGEGRKGEAPREGRLSERIITSFARTFGSDEHIQIAALIRDAAKHSVRREAAMAVQRTLDDETWSIEAHLHLVPAIKGPAWYEWPLQTRAGWGGGDDALTGCLVVPHPVDSRLLTVVTAWHGAGEPTHSYGIGLVHLDDLEEMARSAGLHEGRDRSECLTRIISNIRATIPEGFRAEIAILADGIDDVLDASMRSATAEIPFLLALMIASHVDGGLTAVERDGEHAVLDFENSSGRSVLKGIAARIAGVLGRKPKRPPVAWLR